MDFGLIGKALGGLAAGLLLGWLLWRELKAGWQARVDAAAQKAHTQGQAEADAAAREAEEAVKVAKDEAGQNIFDW